MSCGSGKEPGSGTGTGSNSDMSKRRAMPGPSSGAPVVTPDLASLFECPVCFDYVLPPILQCQSGHLVCSTCRPKLTCCPTCRGPLGNIRNLAMEKVASTVMFPCKYSSTGCGVLQLYADKVEHEDVCEYRPFQCPCPGASCKWLGSLDQVMPHLMMSHKSITTLQGEDIVFLATDINLAGAVDWVMMQSCFGHCFMLVLEKQEKFDGHQQFFALVQLIGSRKQAEAFGYRLELNRHRRRLTWEATPRSIHEGIASAIVSSDCLVFDTSVAQLFADNGNLGINKVAVGTSTAEPTTLTEYRLELLAGVARNLLACTGYQVADASEADINLLLTTSFSAGPGHVHCGYVVDSSGSRTTLSVEEYHKIRELDMKAMSEHKYWVTGREAAMKILAASSVAMDLVQAKTGNSVKLTTNHEIVTSTRETSSRGAAFILYNCARLATIEAKFLDNIAQGIFPPLPPVDQIDTSLLTQEEEWQLLFDFLLEYPALLDRVVERTEQAEIRQHLLCNYIFQLSQLFSVYYRRCRILHEPKPHLLPIMFARLTLAKAIEQVLKHGLKILNIEVINNM